MEKNMIPVRHSNYVIRTATAALLLGFIVWSVLLMQASFAVRSMPINHVYKVHWGPFLIHEIEKVYAPLGYSIRMSIEPGIIWFGLSWIAGGMIVGLWLHRKYKNN